ncbi:hypothetical protein JW964_08235 [candidate division KSB1 bacterium]|nr:hypothetical protein [candidate division KSB1 bacterium]
MKKLVMLFFIIPFLYCATTHSDYFVLELQKNKAVNKILGIFPLQIEKHDPLEIQDQRFLLNQFDKKDRLNLNASLIQTTSQNAIFKKTILAKNKRDKIDVKLFWIIRDYTILAKGSQIWGVAGVAYCFVHKDQIIFSEEFSVSSNCFHCIIGGLKNKLNRAIVNRISIQLMNLGRKKSDSRIPIPEEYEGVQYSADLDIAAQILPQEITLGQESDGYRLKNVRWKSRLGLADTYSWDTLIK